MTIPIITYFSCDWIGSIFLYPRNNAPEKRRDKVIRDKHHQKSLLMGMIIFANLLRPNDDYTAVAKQFSNTKIKLSTDSNLQYVKDCPIWCANWVFKWLQGQTRKKKYTFFLAKSAGNHDDISK